MPVFTVREQQQKQIANSIKKAVATGNIPFAFIEILTWLKHAQAWA
jgi:hypothetical protein